jgi:hypothetical protein
VPSTARCPICDEPGEVVLGPAAAVTVGTVAATLERRPVVACPQRHGGTPTACSGAAMESAEASLARARARWLRDDRCRGCGATLAMPVRRTHRAVPVDAPGLPPVTIHLDLPMTRCPDCGLDQVPSRSQEDLVVVIPALFAPH